jgi:type VI secretion system secreted protein VgrG
LRAYAKLDHQDVPADAIVVQANAREGLSILFEVEIVFVCTDGALDLDALLWTAAALTLSSLATDSEPRFFHGVVEEAGYLGYDESYHRYRVVLRPGLHGLAYRVRTRIFQNKSTVDIVKQVFEDAGIDAAAVVWDTKGTYAPREYCTQWKESELAFVTRLLEDEGIFFWFEHAETDHVLHLGDEKSAHVPITGDAIVVGRRHVDDPETVWDAVYESRLVHDGVMLRDWNFEFAEGPLEANHGESFRQRYEYPGYYTEGPEGVRRAAVRFEEQRARAVTLEAKADVVRFAPGKTFTLDEIEPSPFQADWLITAIEHRFATAEGSATAAATMGSYATTFSAIGADIAFRPPRVTPRPRIHGLESAVVTGPAGEEIHVDESGRIKVHFYWDRENPVDDTASCWIRVQQLNTSGSMILPRLGWEMHVVFVDGDPDRPVALHKAYNEETMPPYAQPANKTQSSLQSSTSPGGGSTNEIRMQDGNGSMEWALHASKDFNVVVANDHDETVDVDAEETVGATFKSSVGGDESGKVSGNQSISVTKGSTTETVGAKTVTVGGSDDWGITGNFGFTSKGDRSDTIGGMMFVRANKVAETFNSSLSRTVDSMQALVAATAIAETVAGSKTESVGAAKAIITPKDHSEAFASTKMLTSGAVLMKAGGDVTFSAKAAVAVTAAGIISIKCADACMIKGSQVRVTSGRAKFKGGGGTFTLSGSIKIDANKFGGKGGPILKLKGNVDFKD